MNCKHCNIPISRTSTRGPAPSYCSDNCRSKASYWRQNPLVERRCQWCSQAYRAKNRRRYCSSECRCKASEWQQTFARPCKVCGEWFAAWRDRECCGRTCAGVARRVPVEQRRARMRMSWRYGNHLRRARIRDTTTKPFGPQDVFDRDGWRCQHCGCKTSLRGGRDHDRFPNLDHIVPLSKGGEHSARNTQCLCRKCNSAKNARMAQDQLVLIG